MAKKTNYSKMEVGPKGKMAGKMGKGQMENEKSIRGPKTRGFDQEDNKLEKQRTQVVKGATPKAPLDHLATDMRDQNGYLKPTEAAVMTAERESHGPEHAYLGAAAPHIKNGFQPVAGNLDAHDTERNPRKPEPGYHNDDGDNE